MDIKGVASRSVGSVTVRSYNHPKFVVADSRFELEIKNVKEFQKGNRIVTDKILMMDLSDAAWSITFYCASDKVWFEADIDSFPEELKSKSQAVFSVSCNGKDVPTTLHSGSFSDSRISYYFANIVQHCKDNTLTLSCRLVITCEGESVLRKKFHDPQISKKSILSNVANMLGDPTFADFTFIVGGQKFKVHKNILAAASPVMKRMFTSDMEEAKTNKCTVDAINSTTFHHLLRFIYRSEVPYWFGIFATSLYEAAHYYDIENLKQFCVQEIHENLSAENALEVFEWVQPYDLEEIKMNAWAIVKRDILKIFIELKNEPLSLKHIHAIIKHREHDKNFWKKLDLEIGVKAEKNS